MVDTSPYRLQQLDDGNVVSYVKYWKNNVDRNGVITQGFEFPAGLFELIVKGRGYTDAILKMAGVELPYYFIGHQREYGY